MLAQNTTRIKLLKIWEILCQETDEEHPIAFISFYIFIGIHNKKKEKTLLIENSD